MASRFGILTAALVVALSISARGDDAGLPGNMDTAVYHASYVKLGAEDLDGILYEPKTLGPKSRIAIVSVFPRTGLGGGEPEELVAYGYRTLKVLPYEEHDSPYDGVPEASAGIRYMRTLPGVERVILIGHSGGAHLVNFYTNVALHGAAGCQRPELLYPCDAKRVAGLAKPDGVMLLDSGVGPINTALAFDPTYVGDKRTRPELDMGSPANGYDPKTGLAHYSPEFLKRYYAAQSARNMDVINHARARLKLVDQGKGDYTGDEPITIPGVFNDVEGQSPLQADLSLLSRTKKPRLLLKADGTMAEVIVHSVRPPSGPKARDLIGTLCCQSLSYSLRTFLMSDAIRTTKDFAVTEDDIVGVDWKSSIDSPVANAAGITLPVLVFTNTCYRLLVTSEIIFEHLASKDKTFAALEGGDHGYAPCKPEYGDTRKRAYDFMDNWLTKPGRF